MLSNGRPDKAADERTGYPRKDAPDNSPRKGNGRRTVDDLLFPDEAKMATAATTPMFWRTARVVVLSFAMRTNKHNFDLPSLLTYEESHG